MNLKEFLEECGYETRSYSGRGMGGKKCLAVSVSDLGRFIADVVSTVTEVGIDTELSDFVVHHFQGMRNDSMGLDTVVYFPSVEWTEGT